jgi:hypothetical protein
MARPAPGGWRARTPKGRCGGPPTGSGSVIPAASIVTVSPPVSPMPPMCEAFTRTELRDLSACNSSLL